MKILCFGSLNYDYTYGVDHFPAPKETLAARSLQRGFGGKGANQSVALARAGLSVCHAGRVGADGQPFLDYLRSNGVNTDFIIKDDAAATGHAIIEVCGGENRILIYGGANREITPAQVEATLAHFGPGDWLVLQNETSALPCLLRTAKARGLSVFFNAAPFGSEIFSYPLELVDILCVNEIKGAALAGCGDAEPATLAAALHQKYPRTKILLTVGADGSYYRDEATQLHVPACRVQAVDTTAAGDTYSGYFLAGLCGGQCVQHAMELAARAAALAVQRAGAAASIPTLAEVEKEADHAEG